MFRYPVSIRELTGGGQTEVACHVHRVSITVQHSDPEFATKVVKFLDHHQDCSTSVDLPETGAPAD